MAGNQSKWNVAAVVEWIIAFIFTFYVLSFAVDFIPALSTRQDKYAGGPTDNTQIGMADAEAQGAAYNPAASAPAGGRYYAGAPTNGYGDTTSSYGNGYKPPEAVQPSRNF